MKKIKLYGRDGIGKFALVDDEDFESLNKFRWFVHIKSNNNNLYCRTGMNKTTFPMHRFVLGLKDPSIFVDHINGNGLDNRKSNLRQCTNQQNLMNRGKQKNNTTGYKGVCFYKNKYMASICYNGKSYHLGMYGTPIEAAKAYDNKAKEFFGEFGRYNF